MNIVVRGRVQGVCFRASARDEARRLGVSGFARNESDGSVYIVAEGEEAAIAAFVAWCHRGPSMSRVTNVSATPGANEGLSGFVIAY